MDIREMKEETMSTEEKLAAAEARALAAEMALSRQCDNMEFVLNHANLHNWHDKFSAELAEDRTPNLSAARELMAKAAERDKFKTMYEAELAFRKAYEEGKGKLYGMGGAITEAAMEHLPCNEAGVNLFFYRQFVHRKAFETVTAERDALAAHVERLKVYLQSLHSECEEHLPGYSYSDQDYANEALLTLTPAASLAVYRDGVLEEVKRKAKPHSMVCRNTLVVDIQDIEAMKEAKQ